MARRRGWRGAIAIRPVGREDEKFRRGSAPPLDILTKSLLHQRSSYPTVRRLKTEAETMLIMKEYTAMGFKWRILRDRGPAWYYLERDGVIIAESGNYRELLALGWYC